jgi:hypothetical protein
VLRFPALALVLVTTPACGPQADDDLLAADADAAPVEEPAATGTIAGRVCNAHVGEWVVGDVVVPLPDDDVLQGRTDRDGAFTMSDVPAGERVVYVLARGFEQAFIVDVVADETVVVRDDDECAPRDSSSPSPGGEGAGG